MDEDAADHMSTACWLLNMYRDKYRLRRWDILALARVYDWAGHIARFGNWAPSRLVWKALKFKDISYLRALENVWRPMSWEEI